MLRLNIVVSPELMLLLLYRVLVLHVEEYCSLEQTNLGVYTTGAWYCIVGLNIVVSRERNLVSLRKAC